MFAMPLQPLESKPSHQNQRMRGGRSRPHSRPQSQHGVTAPQAHEAVLPSRKVFNCIVDDSALVAGVKRSTRNGIRQWVKNGQIRLFVPLHALEQLSIRKNASSRYGEDVRETLDWLDDATTKFGPNVVTLQGADETFESWADVEKFAVPRTLFSEQDSFDDPEPEHDLEALEASTAGHPHIEGVRTLALADLSHGDNNSSAASVRSVGASPSSVQSQPTEASIASPPTSPVKQAVSPAKPMTASSNRDGIPSGLQPLFNYILWRVHQEVDPVKALESFIFLCNDHSKVHYAKGFEIKTKRLEQLREAVIRDDRDFRRRSTPLNKQGNAQLAPAQSSTPSSPELSQSAVSDAEVVFRPPPRAPASMVQQEPNVIDPDTFGRTIPVLPASPRKQIAPSVAGRGSQLPSFGARGIPRGQGRGQGRGSPGGPRGRVMTGGSGRGFPVAPNAKLDASVPAGPQIDPNSFARPRGGGHSGRGNRKLWVPT